MEIETKIKLKFKKTEVELTLEEAKELSANLNEILGEPAPIYIYPMPQITYPQYYPWTFGTIFCDSLTSNSGTITSRNINLTNATILTGKENISLTSEFVPSNWGIK